LSLAGKWMKLLNIILSEVSQAQKAKATCILLYVGHRPNTNRAILYKQVTLRGSHVRVGEGKRKFKKANMVHVLCI
jgi:hypothetical protein